MASRSTGAAPKEGIESMGRRLLFIVGMAILASPSVPAARGQDAARPPQPPDAPSPVPDGPPSAFPADIAPPAVPLMPGDGRETRRSGEKEAAQAKRGRECPKTNDRVSAQDDKEAKPPFDPELQKVQSASGEQAQPPAAPAPLAAADRFTGGGRIADATGLGAVRLRPCPWTD